LSWQLRNENMVIQAVRSPRLAPQFLAALLALGAEVLVGESARALLAGEGKLLADILRQATPHFDSMSAVCVPLDVPGRAWGESRVTRTPADAPIVGAIAVVDLDDSRGARAVVRQARLALTGAWGDPARLVESAGLLVGDALSAARIQQVAAAVEQEVAPRDDFYGSADYRRAMAAVLTRRALEDCQRRWAAPGKE
jgi:carbon-monoxide dehydrogenase medium subunit